MIKINRAEKPKKLADKEEELANQFLKDRKKTVWDKKYIKDALYKMSYGKCCYCETKLTEEGKYMQVEHFHPKSLYPDEVVKWENLLPSCNRCNIKKGAHDTYKDEIINPCEDNPKDYLYMENYRYKCIENNTKARHTIDLLYLNDSDELVLPRVKIGEGIQDNIHDLMVRVNQYNEEIDKSIISKNRIVNCTKNLLKLGQPSNEYSATIATIIQTDKEFKIVKNLMKKNKIWDEELEELELETKKIALIG